MYANQTLKRFLDDLASDKPYPGGGTAACLVAAHAIALGVMVGNIVLARKKNPLAPEKKQQLKSCLTRLKKSINTALKSMEGDTRVYKKVIEAYALPKETKNRAERIEKSLEQGYVFQRDFSRLLIQVRHEFYFIKEIAQGSIASDLVLAENFLDAAFKGAIQTAKVNVEYLKDSQAKHAGMEQLISLQSEYGKISGVPA